MNQHRVQTKITKMAYDVSEMRTRQKRFMTLGEPQGVNHTTELPEQKKTTS